VTKPSNVINTHRISPIVTLRTRATHCDDWRNIAIALIDPDFGEQKAQSGENA